MLHTSRVGALVLVALVLGAAGSCTDSHGGSSRCSPALEADADALLTDTSGETLAKAVLEYQPTDDELKLVAAYWALLAVAYQDGVLPQAFFDARLDREVASVMTHYPSFVDCPTGGHAEGDGGAPPLTPAAASASTSCTCGVSCMPDAAAIGSLLLDVGGLGLEVFGQSAAAKPVLATLRFYADDVVDKVAAAKNLKESFSTYDGVRAITEGVSKDSALSVLQGVGELIATAGTISAAAVAAGASAPALATIAAVGAVVGAGVMGVKIGTKLNTLAEGYEACTACQKDTCGGGGGGAGGGPLDCVPSCSQSEVCLAGECVEKTAQTSCALREPSCCPGHDDSCTAPDAACYCDAYCVTAGDCCPDACSVCGYCG
jgi:hypothetical protein